MYLHYLLLAKSTFTKTVDMSFLSFSQPFPPILQGHLKHNLPAKLLPKYTTIKYTLTHQAQAPPIFPFVVDTCLNEEDLKALQDVIIVSFSLLPPYALVGLITYGTMVRDPPVCVRYSSH